MPSKSKLEILLQPSLLEGWTPFHFAIDCGNKPAIKSLLAFFADCNLDSMLHFWTPSMMKKTPKNLDLMMMDAAVKGDALRLKLFLKLGADIEFVEPKYGFTALLWYVLPSKFLSNFS